VALSPEEMATSMILNLKEKTGRTLEEWIKIANSSTFTKHGEIIKYLKSDYGMTHGYANLVAHKANATDAGSAASSTDLVEAQYSGVKTHLRPIYDKIIARINEFGSNIEISPKKAYVSLRHKKQFGIIQPSTKTRVDVGICLKNTESSDRLEKAGSFNAMVTHRVRLAKVEDVDLELLEWLKQAYHES
jgi:predicted transport protein